MGHVCQIKFIKINSFLKIIDLFLYYNKSSVGTTVNRSDITIHSCLINLREFAYNCFIYKYVKLSRNKDKYYLSLSSLLLVPQMTAQLELIGTVYKNKNIDKSGNVSEILSKIFNKTFDYINYIVIFNKYYKIFDKTTIINIFDTDINIGEFIRNVKKLYYFSYYQIHPTSIETDLTELMEEVKRKINDKIDYLIAIPTSYITPDKIRYLEQLRIKLDTKLGNAKSTISDMERNIKDEFILPRDGITFIDTDDKMNYDINAMINLYDKYGLSDIEINQLYERYKLGNMDGMVSNFNKIYNNIYNFFTN